MPETPVSSSMSRIFCAKIRLLFISNPRTSRLDYHLFKYNEERFNQSYHKRSNVETTFSMIKAKFGERLRSKSDAAQINELLCKVLCHNLCCLIQSIYELGIEPTFWNG